jgi:hypothetical protein
MSASSGMLTDESTCLQAMLDLRDSKNRRVLDTLYGFAFDLASESHRRILGGILGLIKTDSRQFGQGIDIDDGRVKPVPLYCRSVHELGVVCRNQLELFDASAETIRTYYRVMEKSFYGSSVIFRQLLADFEARIKTDFRWELPLGAWDIDYDRPKPQPCDYTTIGHAVWAMRAKLAMFLSGGNIIEQLYDLEGTPLRGSAAERMQIEFVCAGGANNI